MGAWKTRHLPEKVDYRLSGMKAFYINAMLRSLAFSLVGIFTPIYIYKIMRTVTGTGRGALLALIAYYAVVRLTVLLLSIPSSKLIEKIGFRRSVALSIGLLVGYFLALFGAGKVWWLVYVAGGLLGLNIPLYWISRSSVLSLDGETKTIGKELGFLSTMERVGAMLGPIAGAAIIGMWGFRTVYGVAFVVLLTSVVPLFSMPPHQHRNGVSWRGFWQWLRDKNFYHQAIGVVARTFDDYSSTIVWPLLIWLMGINIKTMGWVFSLIGLTALVYRLLTGAVFDWLYNKRHYEDEIFFGLTAIVYGLTWVARVFITTVKGVLIVDGGFGGFGVAYRNVSDDYIVLGGKRMHEIAYYTYRTLTYSLGVLAYLILWWLGVNLSSGNEAVVGGWWRIILFGVTAVMMVVAIVQARESNLG